MFKFLRYGAKKTIFQKVDTAFYDPVTAIKLIQSQHVSFHKEDLQFKIKLGIDLKRSDQNVRGSVNMPLGQKKIIAFIGSDEQNKIALENGVDKIVDEKMFQKWNQEIIEFDTLFSTAEGIKLLKPYARFLGPKGLFPNLKVKTLIAQNEIQSAIENAKLGKLDVQNNDKGEISGQIGKLEFKRETLFSNYNTLMQFILSKRPSELKNKYIKEIQIKSNRGKYLLIDLNTGDPQSKNYALKNYS